MRQSCVRSSPTALRTALPLLKYQPGLYLMMDWVASRLHKAGAAVWAIIFNLDEVDCLFELAMFAG